MIATHPTIGLYAPTSPTGPPAWLAERLTRRQCEVALLVADGYGDKEISRRLGIAPVSVRTYVKRIAKKLNLDTDRNFRIQITRLVVIAWSDEEGVNEMGRMRGHNDLVA